MEMLDILSPVGLGVVETVNMLVEEEEGQLFKETELILLLLEEAAEEEFMELAVLPLLTVMGLFKSYPIKVVARLRV
jgi:hypothetical protein